MSKTAGITLALGLLLSWGCSQSTAPSSDLGLRDLQLDSTATDRGLTDSAIAEAGAKDQAGSDSATRDAGRDLPTVDGAIADASHDSAPPVDQGPADSSIDAIASDAGTVAVTIDRFIGHSDPDAIYPTDVATDSLGRMIFAGYYLRNQGSVTGLFVAAYSATGTSLWTVNFAKAAVADHVALAIDKQDRIVIASRYADGLDFGAGPIAADSAGEGLLLVLDKSGKYLSHRTFGGDGRDQPYGVAIDPQSGDTAIVGLTDSNGFQLAGASSSLQAKSGGDEVFAIRLGTQALVQRFGDAALGTRSTTLGNAIIDATQRLCFVGGSGKRLDFGNNQVLPAVKTTSTTPFYVCLNKSGSAVALRAFSQGPDNAATSLAAAANGDVIVAGRASSGVLLGNTQLNLVGNTLAFVGRLDGAAVNTRWAWAIDNAATDAPRVAAGQDRVVVIEKYFAAAKVAGDTLPKPANSFDIAVIGLELATGKEAFALSLNALKPPSSHYAIAANQKRAYFVGAYDGFVSLYYHGTTHKGFSSTNDAYLGALSW
ncbi:MAG: hypothetical protein H6707_04235 [Deltaproteobacteria bacterium]|nr:hypothetical protein [Deltaproteobacteria bacterium]